MGLWASSGGGGGGSSVVDAKTRRVWFYQDFPAGAGPNLTLTGNENGSGGAAWNGAKIVNNTAVAVTTSGKRLYIGSTRLFSSSVSVTAHTADAVTLSAAPASAWGAVRVWYLYEVSFADAPDGLQDAPDFVKLERLEFLHATYLDAEENLSDIPSASTARTNLGLGNAATRNTGTGAGDVAAGDHDHAGVYVPASGFSVHKNGTAQSVSGNTWTKLTWAAEDWDTNNDFDIANSRFAPASAGKYLLTGDLEFTNVSAGTNYQAAIYKNGSPYRYLHYAYIGVAGSPRVNFAIIVGASAGDYFELYVFHSDSVARNVSGSSVITWFAGARVG